MENYTLSGVIAKDCEVRIINSGKQVISFSIAENKAWEDKSGEKHEKTKWISCTWWNNSAVIPQWLKKGMCVAIVGEPEASAYIDKEGKAVAKLECRVLSLAFLGHIKPKDSGETSSSGSTPNSAHAPQSNTEYPEYADDLPF